jgi:hypothetical protein
MFVAMASSSVPVACKARRATRFDQHLPHAANGLGAGIGHQSPYVSIVKVIDWCRIHSALDYQTSAAYAADCVPPASAAPQPPEYSRIT